MKNSTVVYPTSKSPHSNHARKALHEDTSSSKARGQLFGCVKGVRELTPAERDQMYALLNEYFENVSRSRFERDLQEKEWVWLGYETSTGAIKGFSTLMQLEALIDGISVVAYFSGDTIVSREHWGQTFLSRLMGQHMFELTEGSQGTRVFWLLISSGYKTYRFLPVFFREFFPRHDAPTPQFMKQIIDHLAKLKFGSEYDPERGIVRFADPTPLRPSVAEITEQRLKNPHVRFFSRANPGHLRGDELVCITELSRDNLTSAGLRILRSRGQ